MNLPDESFTLLMHDNNDAVKLNHYVSLWFNAYQLSPMFNVYFRKLGELQTGSHVHFIAQRYIFTFRFRIPIIHTLNNCTETDTHTHTRTRTRTHTHTHARTHTHAQSPNTRITYKHTHHTQTHTLYIWLEPICTRTVLQNVSADHSFLILRRTYCKPSDGSVVICH